MSNIGMVRLKTINYKVDNDICYLSFYINILLSNYWIIKFLSGCKDFWS